MTKAVSNSLPFIYGNGNQYRDFVFVADVVRANLLAANENGASGKIFNVGTGDFVRVNQLWEMIGQLAGVKIEPEYKPSRAGDIIESVANIDRAKKILGFNPEYSFEKGLKETFNYYLTANKRE